MKLIVTFFVVLIVAVLLLGTVLQFKKWIEKIEVFLLFIFTSYICQSMFYTFSSPYDRLTVVTEHLPFWTIRFHFGIIMPITLMWVLVVYRSEASLTWKLTTAFCWMLFGIVCEKIYLVLGVLRSDSISWYPSIDLFFEMVILVASLSFMNYINYILRSERIV